MGVQWLSTAARLMACMGLALVLFQVGLAVASADTIPNGVDVLMLVDQSGSMGGAPYGVPASVVPIPNDPEGLRFAASQAAFNILGVDRLALHRTAEYRLGVISFGGPSAPRQPVSDYAQVTLGLSRIAPSTPREWQASQGTINPVLAGTTWLQQRKNLGSTSFIEPFELACAEFGKHVSIPQPRRVVLVMTDGMPERAYESVDVSAHFSKVRDVVRDCEPLRSAEIHVIGLTNIANPRYFDTVEELWWQVTGSKDRVGLIASNQQLHQRVAGIVSGIVPWGSRVSRKTAVGTHLDRLIFRVFKTSVTDVIRFFPPGSKGSDDYIQCGDLVECEGSTELLQVLTIPFPRAGMWRIEVIAGRDVEIWKTEIPVETTLETPSSIVQFGQARARLRLLTQSGAEWLPSRNPDTQINWAGSTFDDKTGSNPLFITVIDDHYTFDVTPRTAGNAAVHLVGATQGFSEDGSPVEVQVFDNVIQFPSVVPGRLVRLVPTIVAVDGGDPHDLREWWSVVGAHGERPVKLSIEALGPSGTVVRPTDVFSGVPSILATLIGPEENQVVELPIGKDRWETILPARSPGTYEISFTTPPGIRPATAVEDAPTLVFDRGDAPWRAWGVPVGGVVLILSFTALASIAVGQYQVRRPPHLTGSLRIAVDSSGYGEEVLPLGFGTNTKVIHSRRVPGLKIKAMTIRGSSRGSPSIRLVIDVPGTKQAGVRPQRKTVQRFVRGQTENISNGAHRFFIQYQ